MSELRRDFLKSITRAGVLGALGDAAAFLGLNPLWAADARVTPDLVRLSPEIEPLVRLIEETPREKCFEMMAGQLRRGCSYRQFLGALFLAGIRNVNPQPPGFKFHCVFVIHSAHQLSLDATSTKATFISDRCAENFLPPARPGTNCTRQWKRGMRSVPIAPSPH